MKDKTPSPENQESPVQSHGSPASTSRTPQPEEPQQFSTEAQGAKETTPIVEPPYKHSRTASPMEVGEEDHIDVDLTTQHNQMGSPDKAIAAAAAQELLPETDQIDPRQEEEEEEVRNETSQHEEEETPQEHQEDEEGPKETSEVPQADITMESDQQEEKLPTSQSGGVETDSEHAQSPIAEVAGSEVEPVPDDNQSSELEEPVAPTRRKCLVFLNI